MRIRPFIYARASGPEPDASHRFWTRPAPCSALVRGFTLIEVLFYIAIVSIVTGVATFSGLRILEDRAKQESILEVHQVGTLLLTRIQRKIQAAEDVKKGGGESIFDVNPGKIVLNYPDDDTDVIFDSYEKTITLSGRNVTIRKIRVQEGTLPQEDLTSDRVDVENFVVQYLTEGGEPDHVRILMTLKRVNLDNSPSFFAQQSFETAVSVRK